MLTNSNAMLKNQNENSNYEFRTISECKTLQMFGCINHVSDYGGGKRNCTLLHKSYHVRYMFKHTTKLARLIFFMSGSHL